MKFDTIKSGNDLPQSPKLLPLKEKKFSHSFLLISIRNTALKREQSETRLQEGREEIGGRKWFKNINSPMTSFHVKIAFSLLSKNMPIVKQELMIHR